MIAEHTWESLCHGDCFTNDIKLEFRPPIRLLKRSSEAILSLQFFVGI